MNFLHQLWVNLEISVIAAFLTLLFFLYFRKSLERDDRWVAAVVIIYAGTELTAFLLLNLGEHNLWLYNIMVIPQFLILTETLFRKFRNYTLKYLLRAGVVTLCLLHLYNMSLFQGFHQFANYTYIPICGWLATVSFFYLREQMDMIEQLPFDNLISWLAIATLIDNAATLPMLSVLGWTNFIGTEYIIRLWTIVLWLYAFWYLTIVIGLLWTKTSLRSVFYSRSSQL